VDCSQNTISYPCDISLFSSTFETNFGTLGGAVSFRVSNGQLTIENCDFLENGANFGGAIANGGIAPILVNNTKFRNNYGAEAGGALYAYSSVDTDLLIVDRYVEDS
jgi:predicted outer membrane repeat protein